MAGHRSTRLSMLALIQEGILEPGEGLLTFDYMGKRCEADLLPDGLIQWNGSKFTSPYAWASQCKNQVNPDHKSGIGWGHIRYKGIKLSQYKTVYIKKHQLASSESDSLSVGDEPIDVKPPLKHGRKRCLDVPQKSISSSTIGTECVKHLSPHDHSGLQEATKSSAQVFSHSSQSQPTTAQSLIMTVTEAPKMEVLFECTPFSVFEIQQPFSVSVASNTIMIMDFHSHLNVNEVVGYLGGRYNQTTRTLEIVEAFPCRCDVTDLPGCRQVETEINATLVDKKLVLAGWYHSHPVSQPKPSHNDVISQKAYQEFVRSSTGDEPLVGFIISPNLGGIQSSPVSQLEMFHVIVVEQDGLKASPMKMKYSVVWDQYLTQEVVDEMNALATFYKGQTFCPKFMSLWKGETFYINKFKKSLSEVQPKFPEENSDQTFMTYIDQLLGSEFKSLT